MIEPSTIVIGDPDEERTLVDHRFVVANPEPPFEGYGSAIPSNSRNHRPDEETQANWRAAVAQLSGQTRRLVEIAMVVAVLFGLGLVAHQQFQIVGALRDTIEEMRAVHEASHVRSIVESGNRPLTLDSREPAREKTTTKVVANERETLERRGADLIASNDFSGALPHYEMLAELFPENQAFRDVVAVLKAKLR